MVGPRVFVAALLLVSSAGMAPDRPATEEGNCADDDVALGEYAVTLGLEEGLTCAAPLQVDPWACSIGPIPEFCCDTCQEADPTLFVAEYGQKGYTVRAKLPDPDAAMGDGAPLYMWTDGTGTQHDDPADGKFVEYMASRGFAAASVEWDSSLYPSGDDYCSELEAKAEAIFSLSDPSLSSALSVLCGTPGIDCAKGVAVHGFSQGAHMASLASRAAGQDVITAALLFGNGIQARSLSGPSPIMECLKDTEVSQTLTRDNRRYVVSGYDIEFGAETGWTGLNITQQQAAMAGVDCGPENGNCLQEDGSGYFIIYEENCGGCETYFREGCEGCDHTFFYDGYTEDPSDLHDRFVRTCEPWGMKAGLDWLAATAASATSTDFVPACETAP